MCGIAGIYHWGGIQKDARQPLLRAMTSRIHHRGPDDEGYFVDDHAGLGFRRLSIIDLNTGHQPLSNEDGTVWVIFNGEIYNYAELTHELESKGHVFRTVSDTETIVHAYEEWGPACLERLGGMFALAVYDQRKRQLFLARDRLGKKPLYYARVGDSLVFGSEIKALLPFPGLERELDLEAVSDYMSLLYVPAPKTIFRDVRKLPPGHYALMDASGLRVREYWDLRFAPAQVPAGDVVGDLLAHLRRAVTSRLRSDVPLGAFLSGGLDSSTVVALMAEALDKPVLTSSIGFSDDEFNELEYAGAVARHLRTDHHEQMVTPDAMDVLQRLAWHYDEPFGDSSAVPTFYVSQMARRHVTVALSGDGGDENFAGYRRYYFDVRENKVRNLVPRSLRQPLFGTLGSLYPKADYLPQIFRGKAFISNVARTPWAAYFHSVSGFNGDDKNRLLSAEVQRASGGYCTSSIFEDLYHRADGADSLARIQYIDFKTYLPDDILAKVDRASMAVSLEVRCPLLDHELVEHVASLPSNLKLRGTQTKVMLKDAVRRILPDEIIDRKKMGFAVPIGSWLKRELRPLVEEYVLDGRRHDLFDATTTKRIWREHQSGIRERATELWLILMFNLWHDRFVGAADGAGHETAGAPPPAKVHVG